MSEEVEIVEPSLFAGSVADELVASISEIVADKGQCSVVLSGGSTPGAVYRSMATPPRVGEVPWKDVVLFLGDERWVPHDDPQSNSRMVRETLLAPLTVDHAGLDSSGVTAPRFAAIDTSLATPDMGAAAYDAVIREILAGGRDVQDQVEQPPVVFDIVLLGLGEDGHFASVFPESELIDEYRQGKSSGLCRAAVNPHDGSQRISLTPQAIFGAKRVYFLVAGRNKGDVVRRVLTGNEDPLKLPAMLYRKASARITWFLDSGAAIGVDKK